MLDEQRYSVIEQKNRREIVLLRGDGCKWRRCRFCDYHLDFCKNQNENFALNSRILKNVTGKFGVLEVINSGSFTDLDENTVSLILKICIKKNIRTLHFESHWMHRFELSDIRKRFAERGITVKVKIGVESFDRLFRESYLVKGIDTDSPAEIAEYFDEVCLLQGIPGQSLKSMKSDIETGLKHFERVCVNIMCENTMPIKPDRRVIDVFMKELFPIYKDNCRVDILADNLDFGVGEKSV